MKKQYSNRVHFINSYNDIPKSESNMLINIDCSKVYTTKALFEQFSQLLEFPFVVTNWDGFSDFLWDLEQFKTKNADVKKINIYITNIKNVLKNERSYEKELFFLMLNQDYIVNENDEQGKTNFPVNIQLYFNKDEEKYFISTEPTMIWDSRDQ